jgi:hypothetical protein
MNESENKFDAVTDSGNADLREEVQSLKFILTFSLLLSFIFSFFVFVFLMRQNSVLSAQVAQEQQVLGNFQNGGGASQAAELFNRLGEYAKTHPDYAPIYHKYSQVLNIRSNANPAVKK